MVDAGEEKPLVTITGCTGFLGSIVTKLFLEDGGYRVRGTVRDVANVAKIDPLKKTLGSELFEKLELKNANLVGDASSM